MSIKSFIHNYRCSHYKVPIVLNVYFGVPGAGKTTFASYLAKQDLKHDFPVYSNVAIKGCYVLDTKDLGVYDIRNCRVIIDEAGLAYNNRNFKSNFTPESLYWFKYHRHYKCAVDIFSQGYNDMDIKLRTLARNYYVVKRSLIPFFIYRKRIAKKVGINELSKEIIDEYYFVPFSRKYIFTPTLWKMFNSYEAKQLPIKVFNKY